MLVFSQGKNFEKTEIKDLEIAVENEEKLFRCVDGKAVTGPKPKPNTVKVSVKVIDENDPPVFKKEIEKVYRNENGAVGDVLLVPEIKDEDSDVDKLRCGWAAQHQITHPLKQFSFLKICMLFLFYNI